MLIHIDPRTDLSLDVDIQQTFMPGYGLPVPNGDEVVPVVLKTTSKFPRNRRATTRDIHPKGHISLASSYIAPVKSILFEDITNERVSSEGIRPAAHARFTEKDLQRYLSLVGKQTMWTDHGLDGSEESETHPALIELAYSIVQIKGMDPLCDSYSGFRDNLKRSTGLGERLRSIGIKRLFVKGLAFDVCVGLTCLNGVDEEFEMYLIEDGCRSVTPQGERAMKDRLLKAGVKFLLSDQLVAA